MASAKREDKKYVFKKKKIGSEPGAELRDKYSLSSSGTFPEYLEKVKSRKASEQELDEFSLRLIQEFCDSVHEERPPPPVVMNYIATGFTHMLAGGRWEDEFPLPWTKISVPWTAAEFSSLGMFCDIENARRAQPDDKVTVIIKSVASKHARSYEAARAAYYQWKKDLKMKVNN